MGAENKEEIIVGPQITFDAIMDYGSATQYITWTSLYNDTNIKTFFSSWDVFEEGWSFVGSLVVLDGDEEIFTIVSNELPITQETFSMFTNGGSEKIIDLEN